MSEADKNQALAIVIEKLTEIVGNISQDESLGANEKHSGSSTPVSNPADIKSKENLLLNTGEKQANNSTMSQTEKNGSDISEAIRINMDQGGSHNKVVISVPVKVGNVSITNSDGLLKSLKQLDQGIEVAKEKKDDSVKSKDLYRCSKCEYSSHNKHYLKQHVDLVHTTERPFKCPLCDYAGKRSHSLKEHLVVHSPFRPFMCPFCSASFRKKGHLTNHIKLHASEQAVACSICKHFIANRRELSRHLRQAHVGGQVLLCQMCEYATTSESSMIQHMHTHGNQTVYSCSSCRFIGTHKETLKKHVQTHHNGEGSFTISMSASPIRSGPTILLKCSECGFTTSEREIMRDHMYKNHLMCLANQSDSAKDCKSSVQPAAPNTPTTRGTSPNVGEGIDSTADVMDEAGSSNVIFACNSCQLSSCCEEVISNHITKEHSNEEQPDGSGNGNVELSDDEVPVLRMEPPSKWPDAVVVKVDSADSECKVDKISYVCTSCQFSCEEAMQFISHMLSHAPRKMPSLDDISQDRKDQKIATETREDVIEQGFTRDKLDGLYCCLICGYACDHQRTIKAHIWKHSGHKDINYPTFQNGPLSMYEDTSDDRCLANTSNVLAMSLPAESMDSKTVHVVPATSAMKLDDGHIRVQPGSRQGHLDKIHVKGKMTTDHDVTARSVVVINDPNATDSTRKRPSSDSIEQAKKRKGSDYQPSEMDVSMPKLRVMSSEGSGFVIDDHLCKKNSHHDDVIAQSQGQSQLYVLEDKPGEEVKVITEEVIESEDVVEVVVETSETKMGNEDKHSEQAVNLITVLDKDDVSEKEDINDENSLKSQSAEQGISSSLLAVIEHFRKDTSPGQEMVNKEEDGYSKVRDVYMCSMCQHTCQFLGDMQSHIKNHVLQKSGQHAASTSNQNNVPDIPEHEDIASSRCQANKKKAENPVTQEQIKHFICENCEKVFSTVEQLLEHKMKIVCWSKSGGSDSSGLGEKDCFKCNFCDFVGMSVRSVKSHMKRHWNDLRMKHHGNKVTKVNALNEVKNYFVCERCTSVFSSIMDLLTHTSSSCLSAQMPKCAKCSFVSSNAELFKKHMNYHHGQDRLYKCEMCDFVSKSYSKMDSHMKKHIEPCDLHCNLCDFVATSVRSLKSHRKRHTNDQRFVRQPLEQYKCNLCGYICHHLPALKSHMWRHASESNYSYEKTNAVINAAIEDGTQLKDIDDKNTDAAEHDIASDSSQYSTVAMETDLGDSFVAFRCCHCFFETCIKKELNEHMKQHMDIIQKTMEVNNELFCSKITKDATEKEVISI